MFVRMIPFSPSATLDPSGGQVLLVPLTCLRRSYERLRPGLPNGPDDDLSDLPLRAVSIGEGRFEVIDGFKRLDRWRQAGCEEVPVVIERCGGRANHKRMLLLANAPRRTLSALDEALVVESLLTEDGFTVAGVAEFLGRKKAWVMQRQELAESLSAQARTAVAEGRLGPALALQLTTLPERDQERALTARSRHGLTNRETGVLIQAIRVSEPGEIKSFLEDPLPLVRPPPPMAGTAARLEARFEEIRRAVQEFGEMTMPADLAPAARRRLEALQRQVARELARVTRRWESRQPPSDAAAHLHERSHDHDQFPSQTPAIPGHPGHQGRPPGDSGSGGSLQHPGDCPAGRPVSQDRAPGLAGGAPALAGKTGADRQAHPLPRDDHRDGQTKTEGPAHPAGDPGEGLPGRADHPGRSDPEAAGRSAPGRPEEGAVPF
ncbi:MAG: hypothetical protein GX442_26395 [Candidatus Riflebacteria bacterium]|nr:hypothetical protein [Candidatus Riflebacteria bacterium]